ncbi:MAG: hypothetical protein RLZZ618_2305 [Pseudomonadota bacterium]|jgi:Lon protease-like protein
MSARSSTRQLPLFPLQAVLFPGGLLSLKVFESRYLDLVSQCLREQQPFGVVALRQGAEAGRSAESVSFEFTGVMAELIDVDAPQTGILQVRCRGAQRFEVRETKQDADGLWQATVRLLPDDETVLPTDGLVETVRGLANAIGTLKQQGSEPFLKPFHFDNAGWVSNRWCEILPISVAAKQKLMELQDPLVRLQLVADFLRSKGVVS